MKATPMLDIVDMMPTGDLVAEIDGKRYWLRRWEHGTWRACMVSKDHNGWYRVCDDDDYIIKDGKIIAREIGWDLRREDY